MRGSTSIRALSLLVVVVLGCGDDRREDDETGSSTGDGDGDSSTGDGDGDPTAECSSVEQCTVINDCCTCDVVENGAEVPPCEHGCDQPACGTIGISTEPACLVGTCVFEPVSCDLSEVICDIEPPPPCELGYVQSVIDGCFAVCVEPSRCASLPFECDASTCGDGFACVTTQSGAPSRCIPLPPICAGLASCECVGEWWADVCGGSCGEAGGALLCEDGG